MVVVAAGATWKYSDKGSSPGADWTKANFNDGAWSEGAAQLGYGDRDEATKLSDASDSYPTYYFRQRFNVDDPAKLKPLVLRLLRDDGAVVYLNGEEIVRDNMPDGIINHDTFARSTTPSENGFFVHNLASSKLTAGGNLLAIEVHQADAESSDVSFDLELREKLASDKVGPPPPDRSRRGGGRRFGESGLRIPLPSPLTSNANANTSSSLQRLSQAFPPPTAAYCGGTTNPPTGRESTAQRPFIKMATSLPRQPMVPAVAWQS